MVKFTTFRMTHAFLLVSLVLFFFSACKGPQGDPGPQGATGTQGVAGATGAQGPAGSANVIQVTWQRASDRSEPAYPAYKLPSGVSTLNALVVVYITVNGVWLPLPFEYNNGIPEDQLGHYRFTVRDSENAMRLAAYRFNTSVNRYIQIPNPYDVGMRAIIIPAAVIKNGRKAAIDYTDYEAVKSFYNLPD